MATNNKKKKAAAAVAAAALLLLGGTFAWQSISQMALNEASDVINPGGRLHDDFNGTNKDVYVENFTDPEKGGENIYARIRLDEYFEIVMNQGTDAAKTDVITQYTDENDELADSVKTNKATYATHIFGEENATDAYWKWTTGGSKIFMPTFNKNKDSVAADINGEYQYEEGAITERDGTQYDESVVYTDGEILEDVATYDADSNTAEDDGVTTVTEEHTAKSTLGATLISMDEWMTTYNSEPGEYWVYDTDGWVYWAQAIKPGDATGLLLDGIELAQVMDDSWYYAINVIGQFITADDLGKADNTGFYEDPNQAPSAEALALLEKIGVDVTGEAGGSGGENEPIDEPLTFSTLSLLNGTGGTLTYDDERDAYVYEGEDDWVRIGTENIVLPTGETVSYSNENFIYTFDYVDPIVSFEDNAGNGRGYLKDVRGNNVAYTWYWYNGAEFVRYNFSGENTFYVTLKYYENGYDYLGYNGNFDNYTYKSEPVKIIMTGTSEPTTAYEIAITGEDAVVLASDNTTGVPVTLYADGEAVTEEVTWYVTPDDGTHDVRAEVVDGKLRAVESPVMAAPLESFTLEAHVDGDYVDDMTFYMYDAEEHVLTNVETVAESGNTYYLFSHPIVTFIEMPSIDVCAWRYGDSVADIYTYTLEGNFGYSDMAERIDEYVVSGVQPSQITNIVPCGHLTTEE